MVTHSLKELQVRFVPVIAGFCHLQWLGLTMWAYDMLSQSVRQHCEEGMESQCYK